MDDEVVREIMWKDREDYAKRLFGGKRETGFVEKLIGGGDKGFDINNKKVEEAYIKGLMEEVDANVQEIINAFRFSLKYRVLFRGGGIEFAGLREYVPEEDDASRIDWKASLRSGRLYVRQYEEERDLDIYILLDASSSMVCGTQNKLKSEYAAVVAGTIAHAAIETGDKVGFGMFSDRVIVSLTPVGDLTQYYRILKLVVDPRHYGGVCDLDQALSYTLNSLGNRTTLFIISDFIGLGSGWKDSLKMISGKLDRIMGIMVRDLRDSYLPEGIGNMKFADPFSEETVIVNTDKLRDRYNKIAREQERMVEEEFRQSNAGFVKVHTTEPFVKSLVKYLELSEVF